MVGEQELTLTLARGPEFLTHYFHLGGVGGIFVPGCLELPAGKHVCVQVVFDDGPTFRLRGVVRWKRLSGNHRLQAGVAVELDPSEVRARDLVLDHARGREIRFVRRRDHRVPARVEIRYGATSVLLTDLTHDLSESGAFIGTQERLEVGAILRLQLELPGFFFPVRLRGEVAWVREGQGVGVRFIFDSPSAAKRMARFVTRLRQAHEQDVSEP